jgi:hypothetical protein
MTRTSTVTFATKVNLSAPQNRTPPASKKIVVDLGSVADLVRSHTPNPPPSPVPPQEMRQ